MCGAVNELKREAPIAGNAQAVKMLHVTFQTMQIPTRHIQINNPLCMKNCPLQGQGRISSSLPDAARNASGNIAEQVRPFGPARGTDTSIPPRTAKVGVAEPAALTGPPAPTDVTGPAASGGVE